jgi:hypothetical protein
MTLIPSSLILRFAPEMAWPPCIFEENKHA